MQPLLYDPLKIIEAARKCLVEAAQVPGSRIKYAASEILTMSDGQAVKEALATSDFSLLLADSARTRLLQSFEGEAGPLTSLLPVEVVLDFADHKGVMIGNIGQLKELPDEMTAGMEYTALTESSKTFKVKGFGRRIALTLKLLANDRLGGLARVPDQWGRVAAESLEDHLAIPFNTNVEQDGATAIWSAARANCGALALTEANVSTAIAALKAMTYADADATTRKIPCTKVLLLVPDALSETAWKIWTATKYIPAAAAAGISYDPHEMWMRAGWSTPPITVPAFTDVNRWFVVNASRPWFKKVLWREAQQPIFLQKLPYWDQSIAGYGVDESMSLEWGCFFPYGYFVEEYRTIYAEDSDNPW